MSDLPPVPITLEGSSVLHQMFRVRWDGVASAAGGGESRISAEAAALLGGMEQGGRDGSAVFSMLGHKGDLMLVHFRSRFEKLEEVQSCFRKPAPVRLS